MNEFPRLDLSVEFCGLKLDNPLILASGGLGETADTLIPHLEGGVSAVINRTMRLHVDAERKVFPSPHLVIDAKRLYMLNCEWGNLEPWQYWTEVGLPKLKEIGTIILSISGRDIDDCVALAQIFDRHTSLFEINVSCSHSALLYGRLTDDERHISELVTRLKLAVKTPIMVKLGWSPVLPEMARIAAKAGADAISTTNTIGPGLDIHIEDGKPELGIQGGMGGMSGKAIFPIALECVSNVVQAVDIPVMGIGGISSAREVIKMLMVGAQCVQIYSEAFLRGPQIYPRILNQLTNFMLDKKYSSLAQIRGISRPYLQRLSNLDPIIPIVNEDNCPACGVCPQVCLVDAIDMNKTAVINQNTCIGCGACVHVCPPIYDALAWPLSDTVERDLK